MKTGPAAEPGPGAAIPPRTSRRPASRPWVFRVALASFALVFAALFGEVVLRVFFKDRLPVIEDERYLLYRYDSALGWFPIPNTRERVKASRVFTVSHNSLGFRDTEPEPTTRPAVVFLGDSYTWGYDVDAHERFTDKLQARHPEWAVYNLGVSGYGTDQEYLVLEKWWDVFRPRLVFLMFCTLNDDEDNCTNVRYDGYYKPYCVIEGNRLQLRGLPVPRSERAWLADHQQLNRSFLVRLVVRGYYRLASPPVVRNASPTGPILRDMQKFVASKGALLVVGLTEPNPKLQEFLTSFKIPWVDVSTPLRYPGFGWHWTPEGHTVVCDKVDEFLKTGKYMP